MRHGRPPRLLDECNVGAHRVFFTMWAFKRKLHFCTDASSYPLLGSSRYTLAELLTAADWYPTLG
jgi:hypothetical protein